MPTIWLIRPVSLEGLLSAAAWRALSGARAVLTPDDGWLAHLRVAGIDAVATGRHTPDPAPGSAPLRGTNLLAPHAHGHVSPRAAEVAAEVAKRSTDGGVCVVAPDEELTRAIMQRALEDGLEVEFITDPAPRGARLLDLVGVMATLRGPRGCPWDAEQTHQTLAKHLLDETYELLEAIDSGDEQHIAEELGDVLLQVVFHAQMGADARTFDIDDVAGLLIDKLVRRHPHVYGDVQVGSAAEVVANWDAIKEGEKEQHSVLEGVPESLPALAYAQKLQRRAGSAGFDWRDVAGALAKVREEADELARAPESEREAELGDLLFSIVALGRHLGLDAEMALRRSARTFRERLHIIEQIARERGTNLRALSDEELDALWQEAKSR